jgi:hypothetical protein
VDVHHEGKSIRLRVLENLLRKVFWCRREELTVDGRNPHNEELRDYLLFTKHSVYHFKKDEMGGACGTYGGEMKCIQSFGGETEEKRSFGRRKSRWESNFQMNFKEMDWINLAQDRDK